MVQVRDKKYNLQELARRIEEARVDKPDGAVHFDAFAIHNARSILESGLDFHPDIPYPDRNIIIRDAIIGAARAGVVTEESLLNNLRQEEKNHLRLPFQDYTLATSLSIKYSGKLKSKKIGESTVLFYRQLPKKYNRDLIKDRMAKIVKVERPEQFTFVCVKLKARTHSAAVSQALNDLDFIRGTWNYAINRRTHMRFSFGSQDPQSLNSILRGPIHTLHLSDGTLATEQFWYQTEGVQHVKLYDLEKYWDYISNWEKGLRRTLNGFSYFSDIRLWLIRYTRALDNTDHEVAFNKLWALLELLTSSPGKYEQLVKRASFLFHKEERDYSRLVLEHLRDLRNGMVHDDRGRDDMYSYLFQLKWFVEALFQFHLVEGSNFKKVTEACEFLDLPANIDTLKEKLSKYERALKLQSR